MNDTTFSCSHFPNSYSFSFRSKATWDVEKISGKLFAWITNGESKCMLSRLATQRICGENSSSSPETQGVERLSSVDMGRKKFKIRMVFCSACLGKPIVWFRRFWRSVRNACLGKPRVRAKSRSKDESISEIPMNSVDAGSIAYGSEWRKEFGNIQEFWIWEHWRFVRYYENDDRRKRRN